MIRVGGVMPVRTWIVSLAVVASISLLAQTPQNPDWARLEAETMQHFQALLRFDTSNPPGHEKLAADYLKQVFDREGIPAQLFALEPDRPNLIARLKGSGRRQPLLLMGHTDVVTVDPKKWTFPPFSATRDGGYVYGRGSLDDRPHLVAGLMTMLALKRLNVPLDRDVIFLAEAGEEGTTRVGIDFMAREHYQDINAEYCLAEGGETTRVGGRVKFAGIETVEKIPLPLELTAHGTSGHGSIPLQDNPVVHLARAVAALGAWQTPIRLNETTMEYFKRLADISSGDDAARYRAVLTPGSAAAEAADKYFQQREPRHASMLRTSVTPTILNGGYRFNVIPSEAKATIDVRTVPDEKPDAFIEAAKRIINDPAINITISSAVDQRTAGGTTRVDSEAFRTIEAAVTKHYQTVTLPIMQTGATDMSVVRAKGAQCYGINAAVDVEDGPKGFGPHSDQERILESELHRFVRFQWDIVTALAGRK
jgi:acetylornithine deacetylase/succinyl-diaminopimelate desuccinylase-like protein